MNKFIRISTVLTTLVFATLTASATDYYLLADDGYNSSSMSGVGTPAGWGTSSTGSQVATSCTSGNNYFVTDGRGLRTPYTNSDYTFAGASLVYNNGTLSHKLPTGKVLTIGNLIVAENGYCKYALAAAANSTHIVAGAVTIGAGGVLFLPTGFATSQATDSRPCYFRSNISGAGTILLENPTSVAVYDAIHYFSGNNSGFTGPVIISNRVQGVSFDAASAIPGDMSAPAADGLKLYGSLVKFEASGTIGPNRGMTLANTVASTLAVKSGETLTISSPLTGAAGTTLNLGDSTHTGTVQLSAESPNFAGTINVNYGTLYLSGGAVELESQCVKGANGTIIVEQPTGTITATVTGVTGQADGLTPHRCTLSVTEPASGYTAKWYNTSTEAYDLDLAPGYVAAGVFTNVVKVTAPGYIPYYGTGVVSLTWAPTPPGTVYWGALYSEKADGDSSPSLAASEDYTAYFCTVAAAEQMFGASGVDAVTEYLKTHYGTGKSSLAAQGSLLGASDWDDEQYGFIQYYATAVPFSQYLGILFYEDGDTREFRVFGADNAMQKYGTIMFDDMASGTVGDWTHESKGAVVASVEGASGRSDGSVSYHCTLTVTTPETGWTAKWWDGSAFTLSAAPEHATGGVYTDIVEVAATAYTTYYGTGIVRVVQWTQPEIITKLEAVRAARLLGDTSPKTIEISGRQELVETLELRPGDGPLTIVGSNDALITGLTEIFGWQQVGSEFVAPIPTGLNGEPVWFDCLYVNGHRAQRARYPKTGALTKWSSVNLTETSIGSSKYDQTYTIVFNDATLKTYLSACTEAQLRHSICRMPFRWKYYSRRIHSYDAASDTVTLFQHGCGSASQPLTLSSKGKYARVSFENIPGAYTDAGEWLWDVANGTVRYRPLPGETLATFKAYAPLDNLVSVVRFAGVVPADGDLTEPTYVSDIAFSNVTFEGSTCTNGIVTAEGILQVEGTQAGIKGCIQGCVNGQGALRCRFENCHFQHTGNYGICLDKACVSNLISHCTFDDLGGGGVWIGDHRDNPFMKDGYNSQSDRYKYNTDFVKRIYWGDYETKRYHTGAFNEVSDCIIANGGKFMTEGVGCGFSNISDSKITRNVITNFNYSGVNVGWTWGYYGAVDQRNEVSFNLIHHIGNNMMGDMGAIYVIGTLFDTVVSNNIIHTVDAVEYGGWGLYNDEGSEGMLWENNVVTDTSDSSYHMHYGRDNTLRYNTFARAKVAMAKLSRDYGPDKMWARFHTNTIYISSGLTEGMTNFAAKAIYEWVGNNSFNDPVQVNYAAVTSATNGTLTLTFAPNRVFEPTPTYLAWDTTDKGTTRANWGSSRETGYLVSAPGGIFTVDGRRIGIAVSSKLRAFLGAVGWSTAIDYLGPEPFLYKPGLILFGTR